MKRIEVPVLVVGAGPVGLTAGILLSRLGIEHCVVERRDGGLTAPAAHAVNARSFEIWRQAGVDMAAIDRLTTDPRDGGSVYWSERLGDEIIGRLPYERQGDEMLAFTPTPLRNLSQHRLEPVLLESMQSAGSRALFGHQWESSAEDADGITSVVTDLSTGEAIEIRSRHLIAADGAGSRVRKSRGIQPIGPDRIQCFLMVHFAANLRPLVRENPGVLFFVFGPQRGGVFVAHDIDTEWVYMHPIDPDHESIEDYGEARCEALLREAMVDADAPLQVRTRATWVMTAQVAERYRDGRVFLVGDAAHRFPPTGGLGLNSGVQDVHNLVWKIALVEAGIAAPALLDTYESERRPVAQRNADQSLANAMRLIEVSFALGIDPSDAEASRQRVRETLADAEGRGRVQAAIANQAEHFDLLGLQLGYRYALGALLPEAESAEPWPVGDYEPTTIPGARLPHGWVVRDGARVSTLDLVSLARPTLLVGPQGGAWSAAAGDFDAAGLATMQVGRDFEDPDGWWATVVAVGDDGMLLVRPDQHIACRASSMAPKPREVLAAGLAAILGGRAAGGNA